MSNRTLKVNPRAISPKLERKIMLETTVEAAFSPVVTPQAEVASVEAQADQIAPETAQTSELDELTRLRNENEELRLQKAVAGDKILELQREVTKLTNDHRSVSVQLNTVRAELRRTVEERDSYDQMRGEYYEKLCTEKAITLLMGATLMMSSASMIDLIESLVSISDVLQVGNDAVRDRLIQALSHEAAPAAGKLTKDRMVRLTKDREVEAMMSRMSDILLARSGHELLNEMLGLGRTQNKRA